ncbi:MAG: adenosine kinase [Planctomycetota bacterium]|nr:adenosine kinase [Planctomycetota bacterium]
MTSASREFELCAFSDALTDVIYRVNDFTPLEDLGLARGRSIRLSNGQHEALLERLKSMEVVSISAGGSPTNTLCGAARLGCKTAFLGLVGQDELAKEYLSALQSAKVSPFVSERDGKTGVCYTFVDSENERSFGISLGVADRLEFGDLRPAILGKTKHFHTSAYQLRGSKDAFKVLSGLFQEARKAKVSISLDLGDPGVVTTHRDQLEELLSSPIAILQANASEARAFLPELANESSEVLAKALLPYAKCIAITQSDQGCVVASEDEVLTLPALTVETPIDFNGAGDAFGAGFLFGYLRSYSLEEAAQIGIYYASLIISRLGAQSPETIENIKDAASHAFAKVQ